MSFLVLCSRKSPFLDFHLSPSVLPSTMNTQKQLMGWFELSFCNLLEKGLWKLSSALDLFQISYNRMTMLKWRASIVALGFMRQIYELRDSLTFLSISTFTTSPENYRFWFLRKTKRCFLLLRYMNKRIVDGNLWASVLLLGCLQ